MSSKLEMKTSDPLLGVQYNSTLVSLGFHKDLLKFTKEVLNRKLHFCAVLPVQSLCCFITMIKYGN